MKEHDFDSIDWENFGFGYFKCDYNVRMEYKDGKWGEISVHGDDTLNLHISSPCLHYGTQAFEGMKAFRGADGKIRIFRPHENARRMIGSAERLCMAQVDEERFVKAVVECVRLNARFVPPYGTGASLYIRPLLIGVGGVLGVRPSKEYLFTVFVSPVGAYFKGSIDVVINTDYDRAAPRGTGAAKCGGNYAASIYPGEIAHDMGYANVLYLDPRDHKYVEECGSANFFGIKDGAYITPESPSILRSITNLSLQEMAKEMSLKVEKREIPIDELPTFEECGACGTAAIISPIHSIHNPATSEKFVYERSAAEDSYCTKMHDMLQDIQYGRCEDTHGWCVIVEE